MMRDQARRLVRFGALAMAAGFWCAVFFSLYLWHVTPWPHELAWWEKGAAVLLFAMSMVCLNKGQQIVRLAYRYMHAATPTSIPPRGAVFVLYLRAFGEDAARGEPQRLTPMMATDLTPLSSLHALLVLNRSAEQHLIACLRDVGTVIAAGEPGEQLPPVGARRLRLPADNWRGPVLDLMSRARLVVLALDARGGTLWEFVEATRRVPRERLLLVTPESKDKYERFRQKATALLRQRAAEIRRCTGERWTPPELPRNPPIGPKRFFAPLPNMRRSFGCLISYSGDQTPEVTPITPFLMGYGVAGIGSALRRAAHPALKRLLAFEDAILERDHPELFKKREYYRGMRKIATAFLVVGLAFLPYRLKQLAWDTNWDLARMPESWWNGVLYATASIAVGLFGRYIYRRLVVRLAPPAGSP